MGDLGDFLRKLRKDRGWTLRQVEDLTGIPNAHLSQIETGKIEQPQEGMLWDLSQLFKVDFNHLSRLAGRVVATDGVDRRRYIDFALRALEDADPDEQLEMLREVETRARQARNKGKDD